MKNVLCILSVFMILLSCNSDDDNTDNSPQIIEPEVQILGEWKLISVFYVTGFEVDYENENIIFEFRPNNLLVISGNDDPEHVYTNGDYEYEFIEWPPNDIVNYTRYRLKIGNSKWTYSFDNPDYDDFMMSQLGWDGPLWSFAKN